MPARARPTSPHLLVYRWQIGNTLSILHRVTGAGLSIGLAALAYWLLALANGPEAYATAGRFFSSLIGLLILMGFTFAFMYHLLNGVRHLFWDAGRGFEREQRTLSGWAAVIGAVVFTVTFWALCWRFVR